MDSGAKPGVKDSLEAIRATLEAMRRSDAAQPVINLPDWVWGILIHDQIDRAKARRIVLDTVRALQARGGLVDTEFAEFAECVLNDNPDVADG